MKADPEAFGSGAASFAHVLEVGSSLEEVDFERFTPPEGLWDSVAAHLDDPVLVLQADRRDESAAVPHESSADGPTVDESTPPAEGAPVVRLTDHRRSRRMLVSAAAAVVLLVVGAVGFTAGARYFTGGTGSEVVASTTLAVLEGPATASAKLVRSGGEEHLIVTAKDMPPAPAGTHYELWLVDPAVTDPRSLGPMTGSTEVTVPPTIDTTAYPVVDISLQANGTLVHSGHSLLRGTLQ